MYCNIMINENKMESRGYNHFIRKQLGKRRFFKCNITMFAMFLRSGKFNESINDVYKRRK